MSLLTLPTELLHQISTHLPLPSILSLRLTHPSLAAPLTPLFFTSTFTHTTHRLLSISRSPNPLIRDSASRTITTLLLPSSGWSPAYLKSIVCSRHEMRASYPVLDYVPTESESSALDELDTFIARQKEIEEVERDQGLLVEALSAVPLINTIKIACTNPFTHQILRKCWDEYTLQLYTSYLAQADQLLRVLSAALKGGLQIRYLGHERLLAGFFGAPGDGVEAVREKVMQVVKKLRLRGLRVLVSEVVGSGGMHEPELNNLKKFISSAGIGLEELDVGFEALGCKKLGFLPISEGRLHTLSLNGVAIEPGVFFAFLEGHRETIKRLRIRFADIMPNHGSWRGFLGELRDRYGERLEKFQITGLIKSEDGEGEIWLLSPIYKDDWTVIEKESNLVTREIEDFVLRGGPWPKVEDHPLSFD